MSENILRLLAPPPFNIIDNFFSLNFNPGLNKLSKGKESKTSSNLELRTEQWRRLRLIGCPSQDLQNTNSKQS